MYFSGIWVEGEKPHVDERSEWSVVFADHVHRFGDTLFVEGIIGDIEAHASCSLFS